MKKKKMTESQVFRSKIYKAFKDAPKRVYETGSGTCLPTGERDYGFESPSADFSVTRRRDGKFEVVKTDCKGCAVCKHTGICQTCSGSGEVDRRTKRVVR